LISMTDISRTAAPWWEPCVPTFVALPPREEFYNLVSELRKVPYGRRPTSTVLGERAMLVRFVLVVESMGLDKHNAGKFCRLFKLVRSMDEWNSKVPEADRSLGTDLAAALDSFEDFTRLERIRNALLPTREVVLSPAQVQGYQLLQALERARGEVLADFDAEERDILRSLKALRTRRDEFGRQLMVTIPQWSEVRRSRDTTLSRVEREALVNRFESSIDLRARYTQESYLATARANKVQAAERAVYDGFRRLGNETTVRRRVREALLAAAPAAGDLPGGDGEAGHGLVDIAPA